MEKFNLLILMKENYMQFVINLNILAWDMFYAK